LVGIAVVGAWTLSVFSGIVSSALFVAATALKVAFHLGSAVYYAAKSFLPHLPNYKKQKYRELAKENAIGAAAGATALACIVGVFVIGKSATVVTAAIGVVTSVATAALALYAGITGKMPPLPRFLENNKIIKGWRNALERKLHSRVKWRKSVVDELNADPVPFSGPPANRSVNSISPATHGMINATLEKKPRLTNDESNIIHRRIAIADKNPSIVDDVKHESSFSGSFGEYHGEALSYNSDNDNSNKVPSYSNNGNALFSQSNGPKTIGTDSGSGPSQTTESKSIFSVTYNLEE
jgi:hypothetical protein